MPAPFDVAVIVGSSELAENQATIKMLAGGDQVTLPLELIPGTVATQLRSIRIQG